MDDFFSFSRLVPISLRSARVNRFQNWHYFYLSLRLLLYYVCEAIKNHTHYVDRNNCLSIWRKLYEKRRQKSSKKLNLSSPQSKWKSPLSSLNITMAFKSVCFTYVRPGPWQCSWFKSKVVRLSKITRPAHCGDPSEMPAELCFHTTSTSSNFPFTREKSKKKKKKRKINKKDYICSNKHKAVCSDNFSVLSSAES